MNWKNWTRGLRRKIRKIRRQMHPIQAVALGDDKILTTTVWGHEFVVDGRDISLSPHLIVKGEWEKTITRLILSHVKPGMTFVDIGANLGYYSVLAAEMVGPAGKVVAFEVNPRLYEILFANLELNGFLPRSQCVNKAVYSANTELTFNFLTHHQGSGSLYVDEQTARHYNDSLRPQRVEAITLDSVLGDQRVDFIKMDIEGAEMDVLTAAEQVFTRNPQLQAIIEFSPGYVRDPVKAARAWDLLVDWGFSMQHIHRHRLQPISREEALASHSVDLLLRRERKTTVRVAA
jgi:FkbM family methyltransferase